MGGLPPLGAQGALDTLQLPLGLSARFAFIPPENPLTAAKVAHLNLLPQGQPERYQRVETMVETMEEHFGSCTNHGECEAACPKAISIDFIALMNRDYIKAQFKQRRLASQRG